MTGIWFVRLEIMLMKHEIKLVYIRTEAIRYLGDIAQEKEIRIKGRTEPWIDAEIIELMQERDRVLFNANRNKSDSELRKRYNRLRNKLLNRLGKPNLNIFVKK